MNALIEAAARVTTPIALAAFVAAGIIWIIVSRRGRVPLIVWFGIAALTLLGLVPIIVHFTGRAVYRVRVNVVSPEGTPTEAANVWSSLGGEAKKVASGWQFDIPAASIPHDRKLSIWASVDAAFLRGSSELQLSSDHNPTATIKLERQQNAVIRGLVMSRSSQAISGAQVSIAGYDPEAVTTGASGGFLLPAHAARGQHVLVHVQAKGYAGVAEWHPAGDSPATIVLDRK